ncbi:ElyC/SanA/YdcF family protein [Nodosilinea sp. P-1105]|uniref:YdcF family protein n=1 Tax=Nodosilinea sp. P-1105 TaxID=2546229 RepID=UPI00146C0398|nr:ElyC/SanA/YdcF family protein [Nodosilinea sp. P-1105]NMF84240.1 hypothetical protein [Nodosilinea sp. P-1105]
MDILNLLTRLLLWLGIGYFLWWVLRKFIPANFLTWLGGAIILGLIAASFIAPNDTTINTFWQFIAFPLVPLGAALTLLAVALGKGLKKANGQMVLAAILVLTVSSTPLVARALVEQSETAVQRAFDNQRRMCSDICPAVDGVPVDRAVAMVVIGENADSYQLTNTLPSHIDRNAQIDPVLVSRLNSAADVYTRISPQARPFVTVTAGPRFSSEEERQRIQQAIEQRLIVRGVPGDAIRITTDGMNIRDVVVEQRNFLQNQGLFTPRDPDPQSLDRGNREANRVILVAPALTMRRAALAFEKVDLQVVAWPTELYSTPGSPRGQSIARLGDLVPNVNALRLTTRYWQELLASIYYYMRDWLPPFTMQWDEVVETLDPP